MRGAELSWLARVMRRPWYAAWKSLDKFYNGRIYSLYVPSRNRVYTPWFGNGEGEDFARLLGEVRAGGRLTVAPDRCFVLYQLCREAVRRFPEAVVAECGVYSGSTGQLLAGTIAEQMCPFLGWIPLIPSAGCRILPCPSAIIMPRRLLRHLTGVLPARASGLSVLSFPSRSYA